MVILKVLLGIIIYILFLTLYCIFLKGATRLGNAYDEEKEAEEILNKLKLK